MEIWKDIVGYNGHYLISNLGRVKSTSRQIWNGHSMVVSKEKMLKPNKITNGYLQVIFVDTSIMSLKHFTNEHLKDYEIHQR